MKHVIYYIMLLTTLVFIMGINFWIFDHFKTHECVFIKEEHSSSQSQAASSNARILPIAPVPEEPEVVVVASPTDTVQAPEAPESTTDTKSVSAESSSKPTTTPETKDPDPNADTTKSDSSISTEVQEILETLKQATKNILIICPVIMGLLYLLSTLTTLLYCYAFCHFKSLYESNPHNLSSPGFFTKARGFFLKAVPPVNRVVHFLVFVLIFCQTFVFFFHSGCQHVRTKNVFGEYESSKLNELKLYFLMVFLGFWVILEFLFAGWRISITQLHFHYRPFRSNSGRFKRFICNLGYY